MYIAEKCKFCCKNPCECLTPQADDSQRVMPGYVQICPHCGENVPMGIVQQGGMHMGCYGTEIDVWLVSLPDAPEYGFCEIDPKQVMYHLEAIEPGEPYLIQKKTMPAGQYYNMPDFAGF